MVFSTGKNNPWCRFIDVQAGNCIVCTFLGESCPETVRFFCFCRNSQKCLLLHLSHQRCRFYRQLKQSICPIRCVGGFDGVSSCLGSFLGHKSGPFLLFGTRLIVVFPFISTGSDDNLLLSTVVVLLRHTINVDVPLSTPSLIVVEKS